MGFDIGLARLRWRVTDPTAGSIEQTGLFIAGDKSGDYATTVEVMAIELGLS